MGSTTRRLIISGPTAIVVAVLTATLLFGATAERPSATGATSEPAATADAPAAPVTSPASQASAPAPEPQSADVAPAAPRPPAPAAPVEPEEPAVPVIPRNPVPLPDQSGPTISNIELLGCVIVAHVSDPSGVGAVTLSWTGVADPAFPGQWITEPGSSRMQLSIGNNLYQGSRPRPSLGQVFTVTAVDRTMVGNRSQASITIDVNGYPC